ncbi:MAG: hypothetical protein ACKPKO_06365, partial [Candidatus Fonsibacter sp.]
MVNLPSILRKGLIPGGGQTDAVHSQLSAFHILDDRLQESSRARATDAVIFFNFDAVKRLLMVTMSGVLVTRHTLPVSAIERIWIYRSVPLMDNRGGHRSWIRSWVTLADTRVSGLRITGWLGTQKPGHSALLREILTKLKGNPDQ